VIGKDLFIANYDWRMPPAPNDGNADGHISVTADQVAQDVADGQFKSGVDYLGYWLKKAADTWAQDHNGEQLDSVDVIAHSTGGLIARAYVQSDAYGGEYDPVNHRDFPKINQLVMLDVPNYGSSKAWNPLHDDWWIGSTYLDNIEYGEIISRILKYSLLKLEAGQTIYGPDYDITLNDVVLKASNGNVIYDAFGNPLIDKQKFISLYVPTIQTLLSTSAFLDLGNGSLVDVNNDPKWRNWLALDLNAGSGPSDVASRIGALYDVFGNGVDSPVSVSQQVSTESDLGDPQLSLTDKVPLYPIPGTPYFHDVYQKVGDGTVTVTSSIGPFAGDSNVVFQQFVGGTNTDGDVGHLGIVSNPDVQETILKDLRIPVRDQISTKYVGFLGELKTLPGVFGLTKDPIQGFLVDAEGRRLGYSEATGALSEIPNSLYFGGEDGIGFVLGPVDQPAHLELIGLGGPYFAEVSGIDGDQVGGVTASGTLALGEQKSLAITFGPLTSANADPVLAPIPNQTVQLGDVLSFTARATDPNPGERLTFSLDLGAPGGGTIDPSTGAFTWTPTREMSGSNYTITVRVTDSGSPALSAAQTFMITVVDGGVSVDRFSA
jgi:hypothetical protein